MALPLIFLDLDGTIIGPDGGVSAAVWTALEDTRAAGVTLAVCTGRTRGGVARDIAARLGPKGFHVFDSGAVVATPTGELLTTAPIEAALLRPLVEHARSLGPDTMVELYTPDTIYVERLTWRCERHAEVLGLTVEQVDFDDVLSTTGIIRAHWIAPFDALDEALAIDLPHTQISVASSPALPESMFASITAAGVSKASAARTIADHLGIGLANAMAIGDSPGDLPVLEVVGHPRVMAEAPAELRTRFVTLPPLHEDGVIRALEEALGRLGEG